MYRDYYGNGVPHVYEYVQAWSVSNSSIATPSMISTGYAKAHGSNGGQTNFSGSVAISSDIYTDPPPSPYNRQRIYRIRDQFGQYMSSANKWFVTEAYTPASGSSVAGQPKCNSGDIATSGNIYVNSSGQFQDNYSLNGGTNPCTTIANQQIFVS
jgi:hypothetical protein